jgi:uncharacterized membrane protein
MNKISVMESWKYGWGAFKKNWQILIYATAVPFLVGTLMSELFKADELKKGVSTVVYPMLVLVLYYIVKYLLQTLFNIGQTRINIDASYGRVEEKPKYSDLFNSQGIYMRFLMVSILYSLIVLGGFILLIIPGIYIALRYCFAPILVIDKKMGIGEAFDKSKEMTKGKKWKLLGFFAASLVFVLLGLIAIGVGIVITYIIYELAFIHMYRNLVNESDTVENGGQMDFEDIKNEPQDAQKDAENEAEKPQISDDSKVISN